MTAPESPPIWTVIINWKQPQKTCDCIDSLTGSIGKSSIIVIDNGSNDGSVEQIRQKFPEIVFLPQSHNLGFARAANIGIEYALERGAYGIFLLNNDATVTKDTIQRLYDAMSSSDRVGIVSAKIFLTEDPQCLWTVGGMYRARRVIDIGSNEKDVGQYDHMPFDFAYACAMLLRASMLRSIGAFDEQFFMYYEDIDLCLRARISQYDVVLAPDAHAWHIGSLSTHDQPAFKLFHHARSRMLFFAKHLKPTEKPLFYGAELRYIAVLTIRHLLAGNLSGAAAYLRGCLSAMSYRRNNRISGRIEQENR
jgi:GT2 family glycosyltransferase